MKYYIYTPDDSSGRAVVKNENGWVYCRVPLDKARKIVKQLNKKEG